MLKIMCFSLSNLKISYSSESEVYRPFEKSCQFINLGLPMAVFLKLNFTAFCIILSEYLLIIEMSFRSKQ